jgi:hypothetical protein
MTLAAKRSRQITVDGVAFRWKVRGRPTYSQGNGWIPLAFVAEHAERPGALLVATMPYACPDNWMGLPAAAALPGTVASAITQALAGGRRPAVPGPPFALTLDEQAVPAIRYRDEPRPIRRRRRRAGWCRTGGRRLRPQDLTAVNHLRHYRHRR